MREPKRLCLDTQLKDCFIAFMKGFTLLELLIYIAIFSVLALASSSLLWQITKNNNQNYILVELEDNARFCLKKISQTIRQAQAINEPLIGQNSNLLSLQMANPNSNPVVFQVQNNQLTMTLGSQGPYVLTTDQIVISSLLFTNLSYENTPGLIKTNLSLEANDFKQEFSNPPVVSVTTSNSLR